MRRLLIALALVSGPASAEAGNPSGLGVSPTALEMATLLFPVIPAIENRQIDQLAGSMASNLLRTRSASQGPACDPSLGQCKALAIEVARAGAKTILEQQKLRKFEGLAIILAAYMSEDQMHQTVAFLKTQAGSSFARGMSYSTEPSLLPAAATAQIQRLLTLPVQNPEPELWQTFYERTKSLPRAPLPIVPPPPQLPSVPRPQGGQ